MSAEIIHLRTHHAPSPSVRRESRERLPEGPSVAAMMVISICIWWGIVYLGFKVFKFF